MLTTNHLLQMEQVILCNLQNISRLRFHSSSPPASNPCRGPVSRTSPGFSAPNPYRSAISRTSLSFPVPNPYRSAISRTSPSFPAPNPCAGAISRTSLSFSAPNPCRSAISRTSLIFSAPNPCRCAISRTSPGFPAPNPCAGVPFQGPGFVSRYAPKCSRTCPFQKYQQICAKKFGCKEKMSTFALPFERGVVRRGMSSVERLAPGLRFSRFF